MTTAYSEAGRRASPPSDLALHGLTIIVFFAASSMTTPLFPLYQAQWGLSAFVISVVFAVYVGALLVSLLFLGSLSNHFGRRPMIVLALAIESVSLVMFLFAQNGQWLIAARIVQGFATGIATTAVASALLDVDHKAGVLINSIAPMAGMATGALGAGALVQWAPLPLRLVYAIVLVIAAIQILRTLRAAEPFAQRGNTALSLRPSIEIPPRLRSVFVRILPLNIAVWALGALYLSLLPGLLHEMASDGSMGWLSGAAAGCLTLSGAAAVLLFRQHAPVEASKSAALAITMGMAIVFLGTELHQPWLLLLGALPAGVGFGAGFLGVLRSLVVHANASQRAGLVSAFYIASYVPNAILAMLAGYTAQQAGFYAAGKAFCAFIVVMAIMSLLVRVPDVEAIKPA